MAEREMQQQLDLSDTNVRRVGVVQAKFNSEITNKQRESAVELLKEHGIDYDVVDVPGSFELPYMVQQMAKSKRYDGIVALGCLVKGESIHFEVIAYSLAEALQDVSIEHDIPVGFGVITALNREQAEERTWLGEESARAVLRSIQQGQRIANDTIRR